MRANTYLTFNGNCEAAFKFYEQCLGGKIQMMLKQRDTPIAAQMPPGMSDKIMHARMSIGSDTLMGADAPPSMYNPPAGFSVSLILDTPAEAERVFKALSEGASIRMPLQETFWALRFGTLTDRFGIPWMINCERPQ